MVSGDICERVVAPASPQEPQLPGWELLQIVLDFLQLHGKESKRRLQLDGFPRGKVSTRSFKLKTMLKAVFYGG